MSFHVLPGEWTIMPCAAGSVYRRYRRRRVGNESVPDGFVHLTYPYGKPRVEGRVGFKIHTFPSLEEAQAWVECVVTALANGSKLDQIP
jgi:hypothetical protein